MANDGSQTFHWQDDDLDDDNFQIHGRTLLYIVVLFSIILLITFIFFLYARCVVRSRSSSADNAVSTSSLTRNSPPSSQPQGLDAATINSIPITIYHRSPTTTGLSSSETNESSECSICLGVFEEGDKVKVLQSCCHCYHCDCVDKWLITHSSCPMCRASVRVESPV
ncbi:RING-H2 finger protein ATL66 [Lactuca sativa]|uniref:RING-H2 finger protein ATL66 n=1 Tax=Lactuca sativa TaxID=4236 RepID=UPI000CA8B3E0|nr:RING-H2 finger protein ATL66 [Lactuca sativa]